MTIRRAREDKRKLQKWRKEPELGESSQPSDTVDASSSEIASLRQELQTLKSNSEAFQAETRGKFETVTSLLQINNEMLVSLMERTQEKIEQEKEDEMTMAQT